MAIKWIITGLSVICGSLILRIIKSLPYLAGWLSRGSWKKRSSKWGYWTSDTHSWFSKMTSRRSTSTLNSWPRHEASSVCSGRWNGACCSSWECEWLSNASYSRSCSSLNAFPYLQSVTIYLCILIRNSIIHNKFCIIVLNFIYLNYKSSYCTWTDVVFQLEDLFEGFIFIIEALTRSGLLTTSGCAWSGLEAQVHAVNAEFCLFAGRQEVLGFAARMHTNGYVYNNSLRATSFWHYIYTILKSHFWLPLDLSPGTCSEYMIHFCNLKLSILITCSFHLNCVLVIIVSIGGQFALSRTFLLFINSHQDIFINLYNIFMLHKNNIN